MRMPKEIIIAGAAVICVVAAGWIYTSDRHKSSDIYEIAAEIQTESAEAAEIAEPVEVSVKRIKVYIAGAVKKPGVYELDDGSRVEDALKLAGGPEAEADMLRINLAARLKDEQQIIVPKEGETVDKIIMDEQNIESGPRININTADEVKLKELPGIGQAKANNIIAYRTEHGYFKSIEDIKNVSGIGEKIFEQLKDLIITD